MTPTAWQRQEMTNTMLAYVWRSTEKDADSSDDELDLSFVGMAKRMRLHLNKTQKEQVLNKIQRMVGDCIDNALEELLVMGVPPQHPAQTSATPQIHPSPPMFQLNIMPNSGPLHIPTPPTVTAAVDSVGFYVDEQQDCVTYDESTNLTYKEL